MNKTSTLLGNLLDALRTLTLTSRRLSASRHVMRVACKVPTIGLCPWFNQVPEPVEGPSRVPQPRVSPSFRENGTRVPQSRVYLRCNEKKRIKV